MSCILGTFNCVEDSMDTKSCGNCCSGCYKDDIIPAVIVTTVAIAIIAMLTCGILGMKGKIPMPHQVSWGLVGASSAVIGLISMMFAISLIREFCCRRRY